MPIRGGSRSHLWVGPLALLGCLVGTAPAPEAAAAEHWRWPLDGVPVVSRGFDPPPVPWAGGHRGLDLRARLNAEVRAAGAGAVGFAGVLAGRGVVAVHHASGLETTYEPVDAVVRTGQHVTAGQLLGRLRAGHGNCGPGFVCLHWGLRRGDTYLDPRQLFRAGPIRLLPVWPGVPPAPDPGIAEVARVHPSAATAPPRRPHRRPALAGAVAGLAAVTGVAFGARRRRAVR